MALHTEDTQFHAHVGQEPARGKAAVRQAFADLLAQFPDLAFEQVSLIDRKRLLGGGVEDERNCRGDGGSFDVDLLDRITVEAGLVKTKDSYLDAVSMQSQLGLVTAQ